MNACKRYLTNKRYLAKQNLLANIHKEIAPKLQAMRKAESDTYSNRHGLENSPELDGRKASLPDIFRLAMPGRDANPEMEEREAALARAISHDHADESLARPVRW